VLVSCRRYNVVIFVSVRHRYPTHSSRLRDQNFYLLLSSSYFLCSDITTSEPTDPHAIIVGGLEKVMLATRGVEVFGSLGVLAESRARANSYTFNTRCLPSYLRESCCFPQNAATMMRYFFSTNPCITAKQILSIPTSVRNRNNQ
jgi:hypothetical protein